MNANYVKISQLLEGKISQMNLNQLKLFCNLLILEKIKKVEKMTSSSYKSYLEATCLNSKGLNSKSLLIKKQDQINNLINKAESLNNQKEFVLRGELSNLINWFEDNSKSYRILGSII